MSGLPFNAVTILVFNDSTRQEVLDELYQTRALWPLRNPVAVLVDASVGTGTARVQYGDTFDAEIKTPNLAYDTVSKVYQIYQPVHILIVGEPDGLLKNLNVDLAIVSRQAGIHLAELDTLPRSLEYTTYNGTFCVLQQPTVNELKDYLSHKLSSIPARKASIYYCGHGYTNGDLHLKNVSEEEGRFTPTHLKEALESSNRKFGGDLELFLNSCYGIKFVEGLGVSQAEVLAMTAAVNFDHLRASNVSIETLVANAKAGDQNANKWFTWMAVRAARKEFRGSPSVQVGVRGCRLHVHAFAVAGISAAGMLCQFYKIAPAYVRSIARVRKAAETATATTATAEDNTATATTATAEDNTDSK